MGVVLVPLRLKQVPLGGQLLSRSAFLSSVRACLCVNGQVVTAALRTAQPMLRASQPVMRRYSSSLTPNAEAAKEFVEHRQHAFEHAGSTYGDTK